MGTSTYWTKDDNGRKTRVPSVTTVLKYVGDKGGLMHWYFEGGRQAAELEADGHPPIRTIWDLPKGAAEIGTVAHLMVECDVTGHEFQPGAYPAEIVEQAQKAYAVWQRWREARGFEIVESELSLSSVQYGYGGTFDLVARVDGALTLIDVKTGGVYAEHLMQLAAYAMLWAENRPEMPLERLALLRLNKADGGMAWHEWLVDSPSIVQATRGFAAALQVYDVLARRLKKAV